MSTALRQATLKLLLVSFTILFQELLLIRWVGQQVRVLAYFPNIILISSFLGIGLGCLRSKKKDLQGLWPVSLLVLAGVVAWMSGVVFTQESLSDHLWLLYYDLPKSAPVIGHLFLPIMATVILSSISFISLGQMLANCLEDCQRLRSALWGYSWDIIGSSLGVAAFTILSFLQCGPPVWFLLLAVVALILSPQRRGRIVMGGVMVVCVGIAWGIDRADLYSPYYAIGMKRAPDIGATSILTNGSLHQVAMPLRKGDTLGNSYILSAREGYHVPYRLLGRKPRNVLVLGGGTGNDVAVALDEGAESVDVVEIDPVILELGKQVHVDRPYDSPKVRLFNTDARSFLNTPGRSYDLIVFGTLDSMTKLSALSNVRLDNFVYTVESFKAARKRLTADGAVTLYFMVSKRFLGERLVGMLTAAFEQNPWMVNHHRSVFNSILMTGPGFQPREKDLRAAGATGTEVDLKSMLLPHDDWPYLYLQRQHVSAFYLQVASGILVLAIGSVLAFSDRMRKSVRSLRDVDWQMLLFGTAFLLLETRGIIAMNLLWGATWFTNAVVIQSVFLMILLGIGVAAVRPISFKTSFMGLLAALLLVYLCPLDALLSMNPFSKVGVSVVFMGAPILFASIAFSLLFARRKDPGVAFGWNLLGAVLGGLLELSSMALGLKNLVLIAMLCYLLAALSYHYEKTDLSRS